MDQLNLFIYDYITKKLHEIVRDKEKEDLLWEIYNKNKNDKNYIDLCIEYYNKGASGFEVYKYLKFNVIEPYLKRKEAK